MSGSFEFDGFGDTHAENHDPVTSRSLDSFDENEYVRMSDGAIIRWDDVQSYSGSFGESDEDQERRRKTDRFVISSAAGLSAAALALALHRLRKKQ